MLFNHYAWAQLPGNVYLNVLFCYSGISIKKTLPPEQCIKKCPPRQNFPMSYIDKTTRRIKFQSFEGTRNAFVVSVGLNQWRLFRCSKNSPAYHFIFIILGYKKLLVLFTYLNMKISKYNTYIIDLNPSNVACIFLGSSKQQQWEVVPRAAETWTEEAGAAPVSPLPWKLQRQAML